MSGEHRLRFFRFFFGMCTASLSFAPAMTIAQQDGQAAAAAEVARQRTPQDAAPLATPTVPPTNNTDGEQGEQVAPQRTTTTRGRAGEQIGENPRGRALVLGMHLQELKPGSVNVVEVATASPAYDAGIKEGDEIVSFAGFRGDSYRKWIEGISRLTTDAKESSRLPVVLMRSGKQIDAQIRVPESSVGPIKLPIGPAPQPQGLQVAEFGAQGLAGPEGGGNIAIENAGPFNAFFADQSSPASQKAMAEILHVGGSTTSTAAPADNPTIPPKGRNPRVGMAGFRDSATGLLVMVDVAALAPGNYTVAITDPGLFKNAPSPGTMPNIPKASGATEPITLPPSAPRTTNPVDNAPNRPRATGDAQPQSNIRPEAHSEIPTTVLAQVADSTQPTSGASGTTIPPTGQLAPPTAPPTGQVNPSNTTPTGQSTVNNALLDQARRAREANSVAAGADPIAGHRIGTLTVDQNGAGRMQTVVEALRVQDVVGQAIVFYTEGTATQNTLPPNLDPTRDPVGDDAATDQAGQVQQPTSPAAPVPAKVAPGLGASKKDLAPHQPVAAGIIRLMSDRRPIPAVESPSTNAFGDRPQPAANNQSAGENPIR